MKHDIKVKIRFNQDIKRSNGIDSVSFRKGQKLRLRYTQNCNGEYLWLMSNIVLPYRVIDGVNQFKGIYTIIKDKY